MKKNSTPKAKRPKVPAPTPPPPPEPKDTSVIFRSLTPADRLILEAIMKRTGRNTLSGAVVHAFRSLLPLTDLCQEQEKRLALWHDFEVDEHNLRGRLMQIENELREIARRKKANPPVVVRKGRQLEVT